MKNSGKSLLSFIVNEIEVEKDKKPAWFQASNSCKACFIVLFLLLLSQTHLMAIFSNFHESLVHGTPLVVGDGLIIWVTRIALLVGDTLIVLQAFYAYLYLRAWKLKFGN